VVGDPHQSIYGFRGAEVRGILEFPATFRRSDGGPADTVVLGTTRRFGPHILRPAQRIAARLPLPAGVPADARRRFLDPASQAEDDGCVELRTYDNDRAEAEHLADLLRRAHLEEGLGWSDMAVLVRSGRTSIPGLRRALLAAGVPVDVAADDTPLVREPAVARLLDALAIAVDAGVADTSDPAYVDPPRAADLLASPLADMDASDVRVLARRLRSRERVLAQSDGRLPRSSPELVREALLDPAVLADVTDPGQAERRALDLARLLRTVRDELAAGATVEQALWVLWSGTSWPERLQRATRQGGVAARMAHRDLDAVVALFDAASRAEDKQQHTSAETFLHTLRAQQIPADTLAERGVRDDAVRLLTAHRAKGLEWPLVVVAHVQEDAWPDLRRRATLLRADRIGVGGRLVPPTTTRELLADERRLFYVACTRARRRLVVTAVASTDDEGEQPSRFLAELYPDDDGHRIVHVEGRPRRPLSLAGLVAELRRTAADDLQPDALRDAAAARLARLIREHRGGAVRVPGADPATWWGTHAWSAGDRPLRPVDEPVEVSASALTSLTTCPAQWFLNREAGAERATTQAQGFGNVVHTLADRIGRGEETVAGLPREEVVDVLMAHVDAVWGQIPFRTPWSSGREREEVRHALQRFLVKHDAAARKLIATEVPLRADVELPDGQRVQLHGYADRLELDAQGRVVVIDVKTGKTTPSQADIAEHPQLGLYQLAVEHGAVEGHDQPGGAELWQLRQEVGGGMRVQPQAVVRADDDGVRTIERQLMDAARRLRTEEFPARPGTHCAYCAFERFCPARTAGTVLQ
jgi:ATP-dependent exoDNAse (exonuclease V) beta subunit